MSIFPKEMKLFFPCGTKRKSLGTLQPILIQKEANNIQIIAQLMKKTSRALRFKNKKPDLV